MMRFVTPVKIQCLTSCFLPGEVESLHSDISLLGEKASATESRPQTPSEEEAAEEDAKKPSPAEEDEVDLSLASTPTLPEDLPAIR